MKNDRIYQLALTRVPHIGCVQARLLIETFHTAESVFKAKESTLEKIEGIGTVRARSIRSFSGFREQEEELRFMEENKIAPLFLTDEQYPKRLLNCYDPPTLLFYNGTADLNTSKIVAVIGTRNNSEYGKLMTEKIIEELASLQPLILSGLAYGIDAIAHKTALKLQTPTVGVLAHGLDLLYPNQHKTIARDMLANGGGLLTEFRKGTQPDRHNFPSRNRIVAGMCDAVLVIETSQKGGSMITANLANSYNKDVFAVPGKVTDLKSEGCNALIRSNKAVLIQKGTDLIEFMGWAPSRSNSKPIQKSLFVTLSEEERSILNLLEKEKSLSIDEINFACPLSSSSIAAVLLQLELHGIIQSLPGKRYCIQ